MKTLIFKNGSTIDFIDCYSRKEYIQGTQREILDFRFDPKAVSLNDIDELFFADVCTKLML
jgi:hypothetical protein